MLKGLLTTDYGLRTDRKGFTLIELLVVISIIGTLAAAGTVSYSSARSSARDAKRVSDSRQLQAALEIYYEVNSTYPSDGSVGRQGAVLGEPGTIVFSDGGFAPERRGQVYMAMVPKNPLPYGAPYVYRSLKPDGTDCDFGPCDAFELLFFLEKGSGDLKAGVNAVTQDGVTARPGGYDGQEVVVSLPEGFAQVEERVDWYATEGARLATEIAGNETVREVAEKAVAPAAGALAVLNAAVAAGPGFYHFFFFLLQPLRLIRRRKGQAWGVVYNSLSRLPEDLAIVRLKDSRTNRLLRSQVTDAAGRYSFLVGPGAYRLEVSKLKYSFPSRVNPDGETDGPFSDVYHGGSFDVEGEGSVIAFNVPVDPPEALESAVDAVRLRARKARRHNFAVLQLGVGLLAFAVRPTPVTGLILVAQLVVYALFKRLAEPPEPKTWGVVFDQETEKPVAQAVVRIFEGKYNKLLETQVTDGQGRYHFRVGRNTYYLTVSKDGYLKTETTPFDLTAGEVATVIASDLPLRRDAGAKVSVPKATPPDPNRTPIGKVAPLVRRSLDGEGGPKPPAPSAHANGDATNGTAASKSSGPLDLDSILPNYNGNGAAVPPPASAPEPSVPPVPPPAAPPAKKAWFRDI